MSISVIIFSYNFEDYILRCVQSVLDQDYQPLEILCIDDFSTDATFNLLTKLSIKNPKIKLFRNEFQKLQYNSLNQLNLLRTGLTYANGEYIFLLDGDDYWSPMKLASYQQAMSNSADFLFDTPLKVTSNIACRELLLVDYIGVHKASKLIRHLGSPYFATGQTSSLGFKRTALDNLLTKYRMDLPLLWLDLQLGRRAFLDCGLTKHHCKGELTYRVIHNNSDSNSLKEDKKWNDVQGQYKILFGINDWYSVHKAVRLLLVTLFIPKLFINLIKWHFVTVYRKYFKSL